MQLADVKQHLIRTEKEKLKVCTELQKKLCASENMVQALQLELRSSHCAIKSLRDNLRHSEDTVRFLKAELKGKEERIQLLKQRVLLAQHNTKFIQEDMDVMSATDEQSRAHKKAPIACEVQEAKREKQQEAESNKSLIKSLERTIKKMRTENKTKAEELQHTLDKAKEEARDMEMK